MLTCERAMYALLIHQFLVDSKLIRHTDPGLFRSEKSWIYSGSRAFHRRKKKKKLMDRHKFDAHFIKPEMAARQPIAKNYLRILLT
jgi:hypothetical protein